jgi:glycosyltransferase involved in cell wall biosynthesis
VTARFLPDVGGVETHVAEVAPRLVGQGFDVTVLTTDREGSWPRLEQIAGVEVLRVPAYPRDRDWYLAPALLGALRERRPDLVHVQGYHTAVAPLAMASARALGIPYVVTFHSGGHPSAVRTRFRGLQRLALRPGFLAARKLIAVSRFELELFRTELHLRRDRFRLIRNGSSLPRPLTRRAPAGATVVSVGRLEPYKGHRRVLDAWPLVLMDRPDARLRIIGGGPDEAYLRGRVAALGLRDRIEIGPLPASDRQAMANALGEANLAVLLSDYEAHPVAVAEALAVGTPVLVAKTSGLTELADDGLALGIEPDAPSIDVARAILEALDGHERGNGAHGRGRAASRNGHGPRIQLPTWDDTAASLVDLYREVLA